MRTRKGLFAIAVVASLAGLLGVTAAGQDQRQYRLGGTFIGSDGAGHVWNALQIPLDPAGRTAALRVKQPNYSAGLAGILAALGADSVSEFVGEEKMINRDTASYRTIAYGTAQGNPPQLRLILVMFGTIQFTGANNITVTYTTEVYAAAADADGDGYPDEGAMPLFTTPPAVDHARRVPNQ